MSDQLSMRMECVLFVLPFYFELLRPFIRSLVVCRLVKRITVSGSYN
jgi:hypothetical protein